MDNKRINREQWKRYLYPLSIEPGKPKVKAITFNIKANHESGTINVTDLQLQVGKQVTADVPHTSEFLIEKRYGIDEGNSINTTFGTNKLVAKKVGVQPKPYKDYSNMKNRLFNITGRGHEVLVIPNVYHEDYKEELLTSGLELTLYAKEDFDLLRISTDDGALVEGRIYEDIPDHPLNYKYTREFYFEGADAGTKILLSAKQNKATIGTKDVPIGQRTVKIGATKMQFGRQRLMVAPFGSFRLRVEFYKLKDGVFEDVGIGFYGTAEFTQVKGNHLF